MCDLICGCHYCQGWTLISTFDNILLTNQNWELGGKKLCDTKKATKMSYLNCNFQIEKPVYLILSISGGVNGRLGSVVEQYLKFSSWSCSICSWSWLCFFPDGVLGSSKESNWLARSVRTSFSARRLFRSSCRIATCLQGQGLNGLCKYLFVRGCWENVAVEESCDIFAFFIRAGMRSFWYTAASHAK